MTGTGTQDDPWELTTAPGTSKYTMYRDEQGDPLALVCQVGTTTLKYHLSAVEDLTAWLRERGDWVALGAADEMKPAAAGTVEAWARRRTELTSDSSAASPTDRRVCTDRNNDHPGKVGTS